MTTSATLSVAPHLETASLATNEVNEVQLLLCQCSDQKFAIRTDYLAGVYQQTAKEIEQGVDRLETPQGDFPIVSLAKLLSMQLNISLPVDPEDRSLLAIRIGDEMVALRTGNVSRPITMPASAFNRLPRVAHPTDDKNVFSSIAIVDQEAESATDALRLVFDPATALGLKTQSNTDVASAATTDARSTVQPAAANNVGNAGHLLVFMPEDSVDMGNFIFALPLAAVAEVATAHEVLPVCMSSEVLEGYVYWRRQAVPVVRLGHSFGLSEQEVARPAAEELRRGSRRLVVTHTAGGQPVAFYAQTSMQSVRIPVAEAIAPESLKDRPVLGAFQTEMGTLVVPDLASILTSKV